MRASAALAEKLQTSLHFARLREPCSVEVKHKDKIICSVNRGGQLSQWANTETQSGKCFIYIAKCDNSCRVMGADGRFSRTCRRVQGNSGGGGDGFSKRMANLAPESITSEQGLQSRLL